MDKKPTYEALEIAFKNACIELSRYQHCLRDARGWSHDGECTPDQFEKEYLEQAETQIWLEEE